MVCTAKVEITFPKGKRTIEMLLKNPKEIGAIREGSVIMVDTSDDDKPYVGIFKGIHDMLGSLDGTITLGIILI